MCNTTLLGVKLTLGAFKLSGMLPQIVKETDWVGHTDNIIEKEIK